MPRLIEMPAPVQPRRKMRVNEPCWCGSGTKWKRCHMGRENASPTRHYEATAQLRKAFERGYCSHPDAPEGCSARIIRSHTLQRSGALHRIAEEGHVFSTREAVHVLHRTGKLLPQRTGVRSASTFMGFCNRHDSQLFAPIENGALPLNRETAFLLSYRAMSWELFSKRSSVQGLAAIKFDAGRSIDEQGSMQNYMNAFFRGAEQALRELEDWKASLDRSFTAKNYDDQHLYACHFDAPLPLIAACAFQPEYDFTAGDCSTSFMRIWRPLLSP